ncbi:hypothetical protein THIOM_001932 [Candidatus Thiomargarita nelsonii]|uniref:Uncharacterized protein n=1 Tax=Candidatus Thiomargarita nelsonii TaxID=1003181 RepID=A0A176S2M3_9GAMM|nr:hypothetical protein THIOM_001932 [Candidatus Thiomargarita nelsonii]
MEYTFPQGCFIGIRFINCGLIEQCCHKSLLSCRVIRYTCAFSRSHALRGNACIDALRRHLLPYSQGN